MYFNANGSLEKTNTLINEFVEGWPYNHKLTENEQKYLDEVKKIIDTGKSLSEALIFASTNPQYDNRLFIE